jgi:hypothetical protein
VQNKDGLLVIDDFLHGVDVSPSQPTPQFMQPRSTRHHGDIIGWTSKEVPDPSEVCALPSVC